MRRVIARLILPLILIVSVFNLILLWILLPRLYFPEEISFSDKHKDALQMAVDFGRLDAISALLAILGFILGVFALVSFGYITYRAETEARETAEKTAKETAEDTTKKVVNELLKEGGLGESKRPISSKSPVGDEDIDFSRVTEERAGNNDA